MPSFDITSKANMENIKNAVDVSMKMINIITIWFSFRLVYF